MWVNACEVARCMFWVTKISSCMPQPHLKMWVFVVIVEILYLYFFSEPLNTIQAEKKKKTQKEGIFNLKCVLCFFQIYACMMVFFFSNMIENQLMSTGAFEITLNGKSVVHCIQSPVFVWHWLWWNCTVVVSDDLTCVAVSFSLACSVLSW